MKIAVDAMGGDHGPAVVVEGAVTAAREFGLSSVLVGDRAAVEREIVRLKAQDLPISVRHASQVVGMAEPASHALRTLLAGLRHAEHAVADGCRTCCPDTETQSRDVQSASVGSGDTRS